MKIIGLILILFFLINFLVFISRYVKTYKNEGGIKTLKYIFVFLLNLFLDIPPLYVIFVIVSLVVGIWFTFY